MQRWLLGLDESVKCNIGYLTILSNMIARCIPSITEFKLISQYYVT